MDLSKYYVIRNLIKHINQFGCTKYLTSLFVLNFVVWRLYYVLYCLLFFTYFILKAAHDLTTSNNPYLVIESDNTSIKQVEPRNIETWKIIRSKVFDILSFTIKSILFSFPFIFVFYKECFILKLFKIFN